MAWAMPKGRRRVLVSYDVKSFGMYVNGRYVGLSMGGGRASEEARRRISQCLRLVRMARKRRRGWA